jgi:hypothetical protein
VKTFNFRLLFTRYIEGRDVIAQLNAQVPQQDIGRFNELADGLGFAASLVIIKVAAANEIV